MGRVRHMGRGESGRAMLSRFVILFVLFSVVGWVWEVALEFFYGNGFVNRGLLWGPYLPIYGTGAVLMILLLGRLSRRRVEVRGVNIAPLLVYIGAVVVSTAVEYGVGLLLARVYGQRLWDYSDHPCNLGGIICLKVSLRFGLGGLLFLYVLTPLFNRLIDRLHPRGRERLAIALAVLLIGDYAVKMCQ